MNLSFYNQEVDNILYDFIGNDFFTESDLFELIDVITKTIYQYNQDLSKSELKLIVHFLIEQKYQKFYMYDVNSKFNKVSGKTKFISNKSLSDSENMSIHISDLEDEIINNFGMPDKINLNSKNDLISHQYNYPDTTYKESIYIDRQKQVNKLKKLPQPEQKSIEWIKERMNCLTATAIAIALDEDPYSHPAELLLDKNGKGVPFVENANVHHGKKCEHLGTMRYSFRYNIIVGEYGLIRHDKCKFIGASPDGICEENAMNDNKLSKLVGRLLEIKFPKTRQIKTTGDLDGDICPHQYYMQIQTQLFVTGLDECDFLQCKIEEYDSWEDFIQDSDPLIFGLSKKTNLEKGCMIQLLPKKMIGTGDPKMCLYNAQYIYPPRLHMTSDEIEKWISNEILHFHKNELSVNYMIDRIIYWRFSQITCNLIKADTKLFESKIPIIKQFWDYILFYKQHTNKLDNLVKYIKEVGVKQSEEIFKKVHKDFLSVHKDTKYKPLYQTKTSWRQKFDKKNSFYQNKIK